MLDFRQSEGPLEQMQGGRRRRIVEEQGGRRGSQLVQVGPAGVARGKGDQADQEIKGTFPLWAR